MKEQEDWKLYERPENGITEFELENSIATSGEFGSSSMCTE